ncbi:MAG: HAD family hydrolase [Bacillota bacterium]
MSAIFFDLNNTLLCHRGGLAETIGGLLASSGLALAPGEVSAAIRHAYAAHGYEMDLAADEADELRGIHKVATAFSRAIGLDDPVLADQIALAMYDDRFSYYVFPEVYEVLGWLKASGRLSMGIVSNWQPSILPLCRFLKLDSFFDFILGSCSVGSVKPGSAIFLKALALSGTRADETIHVGDDLIRDVMGAKRLGIAPVWLIRENTALISTSCETPAPIIRDLSGLFTLDLKALRAIRWSHQA